MTVLETFVQLDIFLAKYNSRVVDMKYTVGQHICIKSISFILTLYRKLHMCKRDSVPCPLEIFGQFLINYAWTPR